MMTKLDLIKKLKQIEEISLAVISAYRAQQNCQVSLQLKVAMNLLEKELNTPICND
jgi:hypothetical protein